MSDIPYPTMSLNDRGRVALIYLNKCLNARFEIAQHYSQKPTTEYTETQTCLYKFSAPAGNGSSPDHTRFTATFDCPTIKFTCNHEVILYLTVKEVRYHSHGKMEDDDAHVKETFILPFSIPFNHESDCGQNTSGPNMERYTLKMDSSKFEPPNSSKSVDLVALGESLKAHYMPILERTGHNILCFCPLSGLGTSTGPSHFDYPENGSLDGSDHMRLLKKLITGPDNPDNSGFVKETRISLSNDEIIALQFGSVSFRAVCKHDTKIEIEIQDIRFARPDIPSGKYKRNWNIVFLPNSIGDANRGYNGVQHRDDRSEYGSVGSTDDKFLKSTKQAVINCIMKSIIDGTPLGSVFLIRKLLPDTIILKEFEHVSRQATLAPVVRGINKHGDLNYALEKWNAPEMEKEDVFKWDSVQKAYTSESVEFSWTDKDHQDIFNVGDYTLSCWTKNILEIQTNTSVDARAKMYGVTTISQTNSLSFDAITKWTAEITFIYETMIRVRVRYTPPTDERASVAGAPTNRRYKEAVEMLKNAVTNFHASLNDLEGKLQRVFESIPTDLQAQVSGICFARYAFDRSNDLVLELAIREPLGASTPESKDIVHLNINGSGSALNTKTGGN